MSDFNPSRLQLARERSRLFRRELAAVCGVTPHTVSNWEGGSTRPSDDLIDKIAVETGFPNTFFFQDDVERLPDEAATFRARSRIPAKQKHSALAAGAMAQELAAWIEERFELPPVNLPDFTGQPPDLVAQVVRAEWMYGEKPISNMIHLLESRGALVFSLTQDCHELDAFSFWSGKRPIVLLNTIKSAERSRMDAAHELMHLLCHREGTSRKEEEEANSFAGAFLMPKGDVYKRIRKVYNLHQLIDSKQRWGVALSALVYRLRDLELLSDWQYRMMFIELSKRGYRTNEPNSIPREGSTLLAQVFDTLRTQGTGIRHIAGELSWHRQHLEDFIFGLGATLMSIDGGGRQTHKTRASLKLVGSH